MSNSNEQASNLGTSIPAIVEAMVFASSEPVTSDEICQALLREDASLVITSPEISSIIVRLNESYSESGRSFSIVHRGRGYTFVTDARFHPWLQYIQHENVSRKISQSAVETLAIIAYKQPITKPEIEQIRGVDSGYILRTLLEKKLIVVAGRRDSPGKPLLYRTSDTFLLHFGISSVEELPKPREIDEILKDDDMAEHRQLLLELRTQLEEPDEATQGLISDSKRVETRPSDTGNDGISNDDSLDSGNNGLPHPDSLDDDTQNPDLN
ncbi:MAG TPA: SMC-Scp complex subunit ScpB [Bacteroidetes bacterium]|nr:SMC-Scp complex subunit ScpB [Bacteroidota bacterium]